MNVPHPLSEAIIDVRPLGDGFAAAKTTALAKTASLELIRLVVPAEKTIPEHHAKGDITVHCLEGRVDFVVGSVTRRLEAGQLLFVPKGERHSVHGIDDASLLVTIMLR